jgi:hypothetical protein
MIWLEDKTRQRCWCVNTGIELGVHHTEERYFYVYVDERIISPPFKSRADAERFYQQVLITMVEAGEIVRDVPESKAAVFSTEEREIIDLEIQAKKRSNFMLMGANEGMMNLGVSAGDLVARMLNGVVPVGGDYGPLPEQTGALPPRGAMLEEEYEKLQADEYEKRKKEFGVE